MRASGAHGSTRGADAADARNLACEWAGDGIRVNAVAPWQYPHAAHRGRPVRILTTRRGAGAHAGMGRIGEPAGGCRCGGLPACRRRATSLANASPWTAVSCATVDVAVPSMPAGNGQSVAGPALACAGDADHVSICPEPGPCLRSAQCRPRDARFDGLIYIGVTPPGSIAVRCLAPAPKARNVVYFATAVAVAAEAGLRPLCLRCRPELAPGAPAWRPATICARCAAPDRNREHFPMPSRSLPRGARGRSERHLRRLGSPINLRRQPAAGRGNAAGALRQAPAQRHRPAHRRGGPGRRLRQSAPLQRCLPVAYGMWSAGSRQLAAPGSVTGGGTDTTLAEHQKVPALPCALRRAAALFDFRLPRRPCIEQAAWTTTPGGSALRGRGRHVAACERPAGRSPPCCCGRRHAAAGRAVEVSAARVRRLFDLDAMTAAIHAQSRHRRVPARRPLRCFLPA